MIVVKGVKARAVGGARGGARIAAHGAAHTLPVVLVVLAVEAVGSTAKPYPAHIAAGGLGVGVKAMSGAVTRGKAVTTVAAAHALTVVQEEHAAVARHGTREKEPTRARVVGVGSVFGMVRIASVLAGCEAGSRTTSTPSPGSLAGPALAVLLVEALPRASLGAVTTELAGIG